MWDCIGVKITSSIQVLKLIKQAGERVVVCYERPVGCSQQNSLGQDNFVQLEDTAFADEDPSCTSTESEIAELDLEYEELAIVLRSHESRDDSSTSPKHASVSATAKSTGTVSPILNRKLCSGSQSAAKPVFKDGTKQATPKNSDNPDMSLQTSRQSQSGTAKPPVPPRPQIKTVLPTENQNTLETGDLSSEKPERPPPPANNGDKPTEKLIKSTDVAEDTTGAKPVTNKQEVVRESSDDLQSPKENTENHNSWESSEIPYRNRLGPSRRLEGRSFKTESPDSQSTPQSSRTDGELKSANKPTGLTRHIINTSTRLLNLRQVPKTRFTEPGLDTIEPSPKHTPHTSDNEGSDTETGGPGSPSKQASGTGIKLARKEGGLDDSVFIAVKEIGRDLYRSLPTEERIQKLEVMLEKLQNEIDQELENNNSLIREEKETTDTRKKMLFSAALAKSGERLQALTLLMIHYRAGIEDIEALENTSLELESRKADKYENDNILAEEIDQEDESNEVMSPILETLLEDQETVDTPHESVD
ncbi:UNVERIFIED_CONTAM: hypothetical protein K2H54_043075 [Gekko kuhli]